MAKQRRCDNSEIQRTHTSCKNCIFAVYENNTQKWCSANYLTKIDKFHMWRPTFCNEIKHINRPFDFDKLIEVYDEEKEFFIINGIYCYGKRKKKWGDRFDKDKWLDQLKIENKLYYQVIIFANDNFTDIIITLKSLLKQKIKPQYITIVRPFGNAVRPTLLVDYFNNIDIKWNIQNIANADLTDEQIIDMIIGSKPLPYYSVFHAGFSIPQDFFSTINDRIYKNTLKFAILLPNSTNNGMVVSTSIHKIYDGNKQSTLLEKIKKDKGDELLIPITQICPNCPK